LGIGQAGVDTSAVRPITPGNAAPDLYSLSGIGAAERLLQDRSEGRPFWLRAVQHVAHPAGLCAQSRLPTRLVGKASGCPGVAFFGGHCVFGDFGWQKAKQLFKLLTNFLRTAAFNDVDAGRAR
jgi:hypothetical protein